MERSTVESWLKGYITAWGSNDPEELGPGGIRPPRSRGRVRSSGAPLGVGRRSEPSSVRPVVDETPPGSRVALGGPGRLLDPARDRRDLRLAQR